MFRVTSAAVEPPNAWKQNSVTFAVSAACAAPACERHLRGLAALARVKSRTP